VTVGAHCSKYYLKRKLGNPVFSINHYAGQVTYTVEGFLDKNKDQLGARHGNCAAGCPRR
jgi:myosin heavy subunit